MMFDAHREITGEINHQSRRSIRTLPTSVLHSNTFFACDLRVTPWRTSASSYIAMLRARGRARGTVTPLPIQSQFGFFHARRDETVETSEPKSSICLDLTVIKPCQTKVIG
jgi:hypothetical protein